MITSIEVRSALLNLLCMHVTRTPLLSIQYHRSQASLRRLRLILEISLQDLIHRGQARHAQLSRMAFLFGVNSKDFKRTPKTSSSRNLAKQTIKIGRVVFIMKQRWECHPYQLHCRLFHISMFASNYRLRSVSWRWGRVWLSNGMNPLYKPWLHSWWWRRPCAAPS